MTIDLRQVLADSRPCQPFPSGDMPDTRDGHHLGRVMGGLSRDDLEAALTYVSGYDPGAFEAGLRHVSRLRALRAGAR